jgi:protein TonB
MKRAKAESEEPMSARIKKRESARPNSERPYLRAVRSAPPVRAIKKRRPRPVAHPVSFHIREFDPLSRESGRRGPRVGKALGYWIAALALHAAIVTGLIFFGGSDRRLAMSQSPEKVVVRISEPRLPEPLPEPEPVVSPPEMPPIPEKVISRTEKIKEAPKRRFAPTPAPAVADPVDTNAPPPDAAPRRKVVGISFESTVKGGKGPAFAVGNTRMGETGSKARDATNLAPLPKGRSNGTALTPNRVATNIPTSGISLVKPKRQGSVQPTYPALLKTQGIEGNVVVLIRLDSEGKVTSVKVIKGSGYAELDAEAERAARKERFSPALRNGEPIEYSLKYTYRFRVRES